MSEHQGNTGKVNKVNLESSIDRVIWTSGAGCAGAKVGVEVNTHFVGNNSDIKIEISDKSGKVFETVKSKIAGNFFYTQITVPEKAKDELYAEVKLSKLSLTKKSNCMYVYPAVEIKNLKWDKKEARRGDILKLTADVTNVYEGAEAEIQIWEHDSDGAHDLITKFPVIVKNKKIEADWEYEYHEDTDEIPTEEEAEKGYNPPEYFFIVNFSNAIAGEKQESGLLTFRDWIEIKATNGLIKPLEGESYILYLPDGQKKKGNVNNDGIIHEDNVPPGPVFIEFPSIFEMVEVEGGKYTIVESASSEKNSAKYEIVAGENDIEEPELDIIKFYDEEDAWVNREHYDWDENSTEDLKNNNEINIVFDPEDGNAQISEFEDVQENSIIKYHHYEELKTTKEFPIASLHSVTGQSYHLALIHYICLQFIASDGTIIKSPIKCLVKDDQGVIVFEGCSDEVGKVDYNPVPMGEYEVAVGNEKFSVSSSETIHNRKFIFLEEVLP